MCQHYKTALLLIEFDADKPFTLQVRGASVGGWVGEQSKRW